MISYLILYTGFNYNYFLTSSTFRVFVVFFVIFCYFRFKLTYWKRQGIPNDLLSVVDRFFIPIHQADLNSVNKFGNIVGIYDGLSPALMIADPTLVHQVLVKDFHKFPNNKFQSKGGSSVGSNFLFHLEYDVWGRMRSIIAPTFSCDTIKQMKDVFGHSLDFLLFTFDVMSINGRPIELKTYFRSFSFDVISSCAFGIRINSLQNANSDIVKNAKRILNEHLRLGTLVAFLFPYLANVFNIYVFDENALQFLKKLIVRVIGEKINSNTRQLDFIQLLMDSAANGNQMWSKYNRQNINCNEIVDQGILFMMKGCDTTASALSTAAYCLAMNGKCQDFIIEEIDYTFGSKDELDYESLNDMIYLDAFVSEVLRIMPPTIRIERRALVDCHLGKTFVPKDTLVVVPIYAIHHDANNFYDPENFEPDRFLMEGSSSKFNPNAFMPFGSGPRNCIGLKFALFEMKLCLVKILQRFRFEACYDTQIPINFNIQQMTAMPESVKLRITKR